MRNKSANVKQVTWRKCTILRQPLCQKRATIYPLVTRIWADMRNSAGRNVHRHYRETKFKPYVSILSLQFRCNFAYSVVPRLKHYRVITPLARWYCPLKVKLNMLIYRVTRELLSGEEKLNITKKIRFRNRLWEIDIPKHLSLLIARLIFSKLTCHEDCASSNEIDGMRGEEYRSNLDRGQELIPAVRVDEENETIPPRS